MGGPLQMAAQPGGSAAGPAQDAAAPGGLPADVLLVLGTAHGSWEPLARAALASPGPGPWLHDALPRWLDRVLGPHPASWPGAVPAPARLQPPAGAQRWAGVDARGCWALQALLDGMPQARVLALVDTPEDAIAAWLQQHGEGAPEDALALWLASAGRLQAAARAAPDRIVFVDAGAARADPQVLGVPLQQHLGMPCAPWAPPAAATDRTAACVAAAVAAGDPQAQAARAELLALCRSTPSPSADELPPSEAEAPPEARPAAPAAPPIAWAERLRQLAAAPADDPRRLELQHQALSWALDAHRRQAQQAYARLAGELAQHDSSRMQLSNASAERGIVIRQVLETQRELARWFGEVRKLEQSAGPVNARIRAQRVVFQTPVDTGSHRHVDAQLHGLRSPSQGAHDPLVRLVSHHGRPGLALLVEPGKAPPLHDWEPALTEGHRHGLLIVPADAQARGLLERLGTSDWLTLQGLAQLLERELAAAPFESAASWRTIAGRLQRLLRETGPRWRCDAVRFTPAAGPGAEVTLHVAFESPMFDDDVMGSLSLTWRPGSTWSATDAAAPLVWQGPDAPGEAPALASWPVDDDGRPAPHLALPVGPGLQAAARRARWERFTARERDLVCALLESLAQAAARAEASALPAAWPPARLAEAARALHQEAAALGRQPPWKRWLAGRRRAGSPA